MSEFKFRLDKEQLESELNGVATGYPPSKEWVNHIRCLIENMDKKVNGEFVEKWGRRLFENTPEVQMSSDVWTNRVKEILADAGVEVEEEK
jgi:hypothetical protein